MSAHNQLGTLLLNLAPCFSISNLNMNKSQVFRLGFLIIPLLLSSHINAGETLPLGNFCRFDKSGPPVPAGAVIELELPDEAEIGSEIPAALVISNNGSDPFEIDYGGDYRTSGYPQRIKVLARDSDGKKLAELPKESYGFGGGGFGGAETIAPGESHRIEFTLECYISFPKTDIYTIVAGHDLGWNLDEKSPHPLGTAKIKMTLPDQKQARERVDKIYKYITGNSHQTLDLGDRMDLTKHLCVLRHSNYLKALEYYANQGSPEAVEGIGHIIGQDSSKVLLNLLSHENAKIVTTACSQLTRRMPDPPKTKQTAIRRHYPAGHRTIRSNLCFQIRGTRLLKQV